MIVVQESFYQESRMYQGAFRAIGPIVSDLTSWCCKSQLNLTRRAKVFQLSDAIRESTSEGRGNNSIKTSRD
jgi:hypothetical protein